MDQNVNNFGKMFRTQYVVTHLLKKQDKKKRYHHSSSCLKEYIVAIMLMWYLVTSNTINDLQLG